MFRFGITLAVVMLALSTAVAGDSKYIMNFDLIVKMPASDEVVYSHQLQGINFLSGQPFHGRDLGEIEYFLTIADAEGGKGKLTIEFYLYETRKHESDVLAELVGEVSFDSRLTDHYTFRFSSLGRVFSSAVRSVAQSFPLPRSSRP